MEDVFWPELSLSSHVRRSANTSSTAAPLPGVRLQEFSRCPLRQNAEASKSQTQQPPVQEMITGPQVLCFGEERRDDADVDAIAKKKIRLMKNRESAVRSRARKQAYTSELELEVARLAKENDKLRKQLEDIGEEKNKSQVCEEVEKKKGQLQRSMTAPF